MFTSKPQAVEVYQAGAWWPGELLGWRHAADGSCQVWVRVVLGGAEETAWTELETLRLPERHLTMAPEPASAQSVERELSVARHPSSRREHRAEAETASGGATTSIATTSAATTSIATTSTATTSLATVRDLTVVSDATVPPSGGRRRAPEVPAVVSAGGRRRAPEEPVAVASGGRRRAPETATALQAVAPGPGAAPRTVTAAVSDGVSSGRRRAPEEPVAVPSRGRRRAPEVSEAVASGPAALPGRRGVPPVTASPAAAPPAAAPSAAMPPADAGRHRTADTGMLPAVSDATATFRGTRRPAGPAASGRGRTVPAARAVTQPSLPASSEGSSTGRWEAPRGLESEMLTRPMRLSDHRPSSRRPSLDGVLRGS